MSLEIDVTKSMCLKSVQQDAAIENRLQSIVTDWKTDEDEHQESSVNSSFNNSGNLDHLLTNQKLLVANANTRKAQDGANLNKTKLFLSFPLKRLYPLGKGASSIVYKTLKLNNLKIYAEKVLVVSDPVKKKQIIREIESLRSMFSQSPPTDENNPFTPYSKENNSDIYSPDKKQQQIPDLYTPKRIRAHCQYIVELYDVLQNPLDGTLSLCLEYMNNGSLQDIVSLGGCNDETILSSISYQILCGLQFLHSLRIVHRDVKPSNILLSLDGHIKLSDFGLAKTMDLGHSLADSFIGTFEYMAPERLSGESYSFSSDIYSFGLSVHTLSLGRFPYDNKKGFWELLHITQQENKPLPSSELFSEEFIRFISLSTNRNMKDRPSADQLLSFPFVQSKLDVVPPDLWNPFMKELEERKLNPQKAKASSQKPRKQNQPTEQEEELSPKKKNESPTAIIATAVPTSSRVGNISNRKEAPSSLGIVTTGRKNTGSNTGRAAESLNIEERKKRHSFHHENNNSSSNRENSSKPPLPSARFISPQVQQQQQPQTTGNKSSARSNESPSSSVTTNNNKKPNASPRRLANNPSNTNNSNTNERKGGNSSTPRLLQQNSSSSTSGKFSGKQTSLPVIPTANITTTTAPSVSPKRNNVNNPVNNNNNNPNKTKSNDSNNNNSKIPLIPLHKISTNHDNKNEALHSLHPEKQLDNSEITNVVSEWARFVVKYFQYEMKQAKEQQQYSNDSEDNNTQSSGKPDGGNSFSPEKRPAVPSFDKKSLFITKAVIKGLSSDLNCSEEKLLSLFQVKIKEIQQQLGDIIHYYDRTTQQQRRQEQQQNKKLVKEMTPVNRNYSNRSPERKKLPPNLLKEQERKQQQQQQSLQLLVPQLQLESAQSATPPAKALLSSPAVPAPPLPSSSEKSTFHHQLTISVDPLKAVKKKSTKSIKDFGDEDLPTPGELHPGSSSGKKLNLETIANSAETLESFIQLDTKEWESFQQSFRVGNNKDILEIETSHKKKTGRQSYDGGTQEMKTAMIRSLDSRLPDLTPPPSSSAKIRTSMSSSKELIKRKSAADFKEALFNKGATLVQPGEEEEDQQPPPMKNMTNTSGVFRRSFPEKNPLLTSVSSDVALVTSTSNLLFSQNNQINVGQSTKNNDREQGSYQHHFVRSQSDSTREIVGSSHHSMHDRSQRRKSREYYDQKNDFEEMDSKRIPDKENHFYDTNNENHSHSDIEEDEDIYKTNTRDYDDHEEEDNSDVLLDMSSILEESILLQQEKQQERNRSCGNIVDEIAFTRHSSKNNTKRNSISGYSEVDDDYDYDNDDLGEGAAEEVASFNPSPFATPRESKYEPAKAVPSQQKQSQRQEKHRNSAVEYSMVFDEIPSEAKHTKNNNKTSENYDSDEFED
jgi:serine/threonine protein kinase